MICDLESPVESTDSHGAQRTAHLPWPGATRPQAPSEDARPAGVNAEGNVGHTCILKISGRTVRSCLDVYYPVWTSDFMLYGL